MPFKDIEFDDDDESDDGLEIHDDEPLLLGLSSLMAFLSGAIFIGNQSHCLAVP
jgi:hypothetical protein